MDSDDLARTILRAATEMAEILGDGETVDSGAVSTWTAVHGTFSPMQVDLGQISQAVLAGDTDAVLRTISEAVQPLATAAMVACGLALGAGESVVRQHLGADGVRLLFDTARQMANTDDA